MNAQQFYDAFLLGWGAPQCPVPLKRMAGRTLKWKAATPVGALTFAFATNARTAGLLPHLPGEFRLGIGWDHHDGAVRKSDVVSWFQFATNDDSKTYAAQQRAALEKFLAQPDKAALREIYNYTNDPSWLPCPNFDEFAYYFDAADAESWGRWYGTRIASWLERFTAAPEAFNDWCWRVLWSNPNPSA